MVIVSDTVITWNDIKDIINRRDLDQLYRSHKQTEEYHQFKSEVNSTGDSVVNYILKRRLNWIDSNGELDHTPKSTKLFDDPDDVKIIRNDYPYNFEPNVTHLCAWSKIPIESDPNSSLGDVTDEIRKVIDRYVEETFIEGLGLNREDVLWFRNYPALQSVTEVSHIHVLIRNLDREIGRKYNI